VEMKSGQKRQLETELKRFDDLIGELSRTHVVQTLADHVHIIRPKAIAPRPEGRDVDLTIAGLIHGVEVAGLAVLVDLLTLVTSGRLAISLSLGVALGNVPAARQQKRFVERDLNRSFGRPDTTSAEDRRADDLERLFSRSHYLLDIHQVKLSCDRPFWIFPYTKSGFAFARAVAPEVSLITHWGKGFSADGQCSDEWTNGHGGSGVTIELGQNGFDEVQIERGVAIACRALEVATAVMNGGLPHDTGGRKAPVYTWAEIVPYPATGAPVLDPDWHNFRIATEGQRLGLFNGQEILAPVTGPVLFPKYPDTSPDGRYGSERPAAELIRILREISEAELPS
jgi:succinylglutamate desuccinylase